MITDKNFVTPNSDQQLLVALIGRIEVAQVGRYAMNEKILEAIRLLSGLEDHIPAVKLALALLRKMERDLLRAATQEGAANNPIEKATARLIQAGVDPYAKYNRGWQD